jgi:hypothetical protein
MIASSMEHTNRSIGVNYEGILERIQDPVLKEVIETSVNQITQTAAQSGYNGLFYTTVVISALVIIMAIILKPVRNKNIKNSKATP